MDFVYLRETIKQLIGFDPCGIQKLVKKLDFKCNKLASVSCCLKWHDIERN